MSRRWAVKSFHWSLSNWVTGVLPFNRMPASTAYWLRWLHSDGNEEFGRVARLTVPHVGAAVCQNEHTCLLKNKGRFVSEQKDWCFSCLAEDFQKQSFPKYTFTLWAQFRVLSWPLLRIGFLTTLDRSRRCSFGNRMAFRSSDFRPN